jgi:hypothetical protein
VLKTSLAVDVVSNFQTMRSNALSSRIGLLMTVRTEVDVYVEKNVIFVVQTVLDTVTLSVGFG